MAGKDKKIQKSGRMPMHVETLFTGIREIILSARQAVVCSVNTLQVFTNFEIGRRIVEHEQKGEHRAKYGKKTLEELARRLTVEFGRGFSLTNLKLMRQFYLLYQKQIRQTLSGESCALKIGQTAPDQFKKLRTTSRKLPAQFTLSWSHYVFLMGIMKTDERRFYEIEAAEQNWSLRELKRQFDASLYERLVLSRDKASVQKLGEKGQIVEKPQDLLKEPYVLEFLGLDEKVSYCESDLEAAIIDKLEHFLLELGKGFLFEARQKRFTFDEDHFFVDLVFYNRLLRCYVLIDLKIGKLAHQDIGQMQMYVNYFDRYVKTENEHPTVGIILCKKKHNAIVEITLPKDANIHASEYQLYLPEKEELKRKLFEWEIEAELSEKCDK
jgi:predicted nuclease of restriction endonuclease-like (RecB) superfamily